METSRVVLITGGTGLIGEELTVELLKRGYSVILTGRKPEHKFRQSFTLPCKYVQWQEPHKSLPPAGVLEAEHIIHLMGEPIAEKNWSSAVKKRLVESRINTTKNLLKRFAKQQHLKTFISASAIGIYGNQGDKELDEGSNPDDGFLGQLCQDWERNAQKAPCRSVQLRLGLVLSQRGGALKKMESIFNKGVGGKLGDGKQWMSWVHIKDVIQSIVFSLENTSVEGPINLVGPNPCRNSLFTKALGKVLKVPTFLPAPKFGLKVLYGEMSQILFDSQKVLPKKLLALGFSFQFESINQALDDLYLWKEKSADHFYFQRQWIPDAIDEAFPFFADPYNLEKITPPFLNFKILNSSTPMISEGTLINYQLKLHGIPIGWKTLIKDWKPLEQFVDTQLKGPYAKWHHTHRFIPLAGGTLLEDEVIYRLPLHKIGGNIAHSYVLADVNKIFKYRKDNLEHAISGVMPQKQCPQSPNCVFTRATRDGQKMEPIPFAEYSPEIKKKIIRHITELPRTHLVDEADSYLRFTLTSALFRFVDDVEFFIDSEAKLIHFRSASRVGYSDLGANRKRMEQISEKLKKSLKERNQSKE